MEARDESRFILFVYRRKRFLNIAGLTAMAAMFFILFADLIINGYIIDQATVLETAGFMMSMVLSFVFGVCYGVGNYGGDKRQNVIYQILILMAYSFAFFWAVTGVSESLGVRSTWIEIGYTVGAFFTLMSIFFFCAYDQTFFHISKRTDRLLLGIRIVFIILYFILLITNRLTGLFYYEDRNGIILIGSLYSLWWIYALGLLVLYSILVVRFIPNKRTRIPLLFEKAALMTWFVIDSIPNNALSRSLVFVQNYATVISLLIIFCFIYIEGARTLSKQKRELEKSKLRALQLQMNPHLIYNTLTSIAALCRTDPEKTEDMVYKFSDYLRDIFSDSEKENYITFSEEIKRLRNYIAVEQQRFPGLKVEYRIGTIAFRIPAMTLQPLVENAIKHGICKRRKSEGTIIISSEETEEAFIVLVEDDGVGFVEGRNTKENPHRQGVGIKNTRKRLEILCNGKLEITSTPGTGTISKVTIPKEERAE